ncbi:MAG: 6-phosphogluconolactonase [Novosphingobium sp.]|jgi:6-phosphogluconolactonase|uniref:6-phosphogluconolactonase n=1 Tax=Novosphingobium sp. TaxID=1874826 RepID=UPI003017DBAF
MTDVVWAYPGDAGAVAAHVARVIARHGPKRLAFTGGSTPLKVFALLAQQGLDWSDVTITLTDDRRVPDDHPASNFGKLNAALGASGAAFERLEEGMAVQPFDLVWLGMGEDGHIASLFPHMHALVRPGPSVIATTPIPLPPEAPFDRLTLNKRALKATREIILVVTGASKKALLEQVLAGSDAYPVSDILRGYGPPVTIYWSE